MSGATLRKIYVYPHQGSSCQESDECAVTAENGLDGDRKRSPRRAVTLLSSEVWAETTVGMGVALPPETRRANLLVSGIDLQAAVGRCLQIGEVVLRVLGETEPCHKMDEKHTGLRQALEPEMRAGVCSAVEMGGILKVGDAVLLVESS